MKPIIIRGQRIFAGYQNESLTYTVQLLSPSYPVPTAKDIVWTGPSGVIKNGSKHALDADARSLIIKHLQSSDAGVYAVTVINAIGSDSTQFSVEVYGKIKHQSTNGAFFRH